MPLTITKLANNNVEITGREQAYTLLPTMNVFRDKSGIDGVKLMSDGMVKDSISAANVAALISLAGTVNNPTGDQLYDELKTNFFNR